MMSEWTGNFDEALQKQKQKKNTPVLIWRRTETGQIRKNKRLVTTGTRAVITGQRTGRANQNPCNFTELDFNVKPSRWRFLTLTRTSPSTVKRKDTRALYGATAATPPLPWGLAGLGEMACCTPPPVIPPPPPSVWSREHCLRRQQPDLIISEQSLWKEVVWILSARRQTGREDLCHSRGLPSTAAQTLWSIGAFLSNEKRTLLHLHLLPSSVRLSSPVSF